MINAPEISNNTTIVLNQISESHIAIKNQITTYLSIVFEPDLLHNGIGAIFLTSAMGYPFLSLALTSVITSPILLYTRLGPNVFIPLLEMNNSRTQNCKISYYEYYHLLNISLEFFIDISSGDLKESAHVDFINHLTQNNMIDEITALVKMGAKLEDFENCQAYEAIKSKALLFAVESNPEDLSDLFRNNIEPYVVNYRLRQSQEPNFQQQQALYEEDNNNRFGCFRWNNQ